MRPIARFESLTPSRPLSRGVGLVKTVGLVALGGALGSVLRFGLGRALESWNPHAAFSMGTLAANLIGCLLMGLLVVWVAQFEQVSQEMLKAFLLTGFLGGLTTFSTFAFELFRLGQERHGKLLLTHLGSHLLIGTLGLWLGYAWAKRYWP